MLGLYAARVVKMTQMPELVALMHSLVGLAAMLVGLRELHRPGGHRAFQGRGKAPSTDEIYIGVLIGAVTFSGSLIAFGKLSAQDQRQAVAAAGDATGSTWPVWWRNLAAAHSFVGAADSIGTA